MGNKLAWLGMTLMLAVPSLGVTVPHVQVVGAVIMTIGTGMLMLNK